jgi:DNA topoisomerase-1
MPTKKILSKIKLIIVESPTKAKTIAQFLGNDFLVESCQGHVRDLPKGKIGVDVEKNFEPQYVIPTKKRKIVSNLKKLSSKSEEVYFASDEDREGESISWHLSEILKAKNTHRIAFHEITEEAIKQALAEPREIDQNMVQAQQARRVLDRLVGYELSPLLWRKIFKGLSAGRVQSPTVRLIVEREKEINNFKPEEYWSIEAELKADKENFIAKLIKENEKTLSKFDLKTKEQIEKITAILEKSEYVVIKTQTKKLQKPPLPPFTTSTLQQQANKELGFSVKKTMLVAQQLYEGVDLGEKKRIGLITYMRTDSLNLAEKFLSEVGGFVSQNYGKNYLKIKHYKINSKNAQEAHEAIRPTSCHFLPEKIKDSLTLDQFKIYNLIWRRAVASQMNWATLNSSSVDISANQYILRANGLNVKFDGWLKLYPEKQKENLLPSLIEGQKLSLIKINPLQHFTEPPARYTEASLVKALEDYGIGRPSTYAPIISTIQQRNYVRKEQKSFKPTETGILVNDLLSEHFPNIVDYQFTAQMENDLDEIAQGKKEYLVMLQNFYQPFKQNLNMKEKQITKTFVDEQTDQTCPKCNEPLIIKTGRFGRFLACSGFPKCRFTQSLEKNSNQPENTQTGIKCPKCHENEIVKKRTKKGKFFYGCAGWPKCDFALWDEPTEEKCPKCGSLMVKKVDKIKCSNKDCQK